MKSKYPRKGMRESLQEFAGRHKLPLNVARGFWRREGLRLLGLPLGIQMGYLNITPGVAIDWKPEWKSEEEFE